MDLLNELARTDIDPALLAQVQALIAQQQAKLAQQDTVLAEMISRSKRSRSSWRITSACASARPVKRRSENSAC